MQQHRREDLGRSLKAEAFSGSVIVALGERVEALLGQPVGVHFSGQQTTQPADGVFDAAFLPRRLGVAEIGLHLQAGVQLLMVRRLGRRYRR